MKFISCLLLTAIIIFTARNNNTSANNNADTKSSSANPKDWKLGMELWTFHDVSFQQALTRTDSAGITYIEANTFTAMGGDFKDSLLSALSPAGIEKVKEMIAQKNLKVLSMYINGDTNIETWKKQFDVAKAFGVGFVTTEPPLNMLNSVDSIAGAYGIKVAIHEHWKGFSHYWNPDTTLMAIKNHPNFYVCADLGHWPKSGINPLDAVKKLSGHIIAIHLKDIADYNNPALKDVRIGTGKVDFPAIFAELKNQNFSGPIYIERDSIEPGGNLASVIEEKKYYNSLISKMK